MSTTQVSVSDFKAHCTAILRDLDRHPQRIEVTNRGRVIAVVSPAESAASDEPATWLGSLRGSVLRYDAPFAPAVDASDWDAARL
jgi:antitoxin (DNA-binding transcriptional repressor) of toxin-antitoxin stability system